MSVWMQNNGRVHFRFLSWLNTQFFKVPYLKTIQQNGSMLANSAIRRN